MIGVRKICAWILLGLKAVLSKWLMIFLRFRLQSELLLMFNPLLPVLPWLQKSKKNLSCEEMLSHLSKRKWDNASGSSDTFSYLSVFAKPIDIIFEKDLSENKLGGGINTRL